MMSNQDKYNNFSSFLHSVKEFIELKSSRRGSNTIIEEALKTYLSIPSIDFIALYMLNFSTFDFDYHSSIPDDADKSKKLYHFALESGFVGNALESGKIYCNTSFYSLDFKGIIVIPLADNSGITGLIIISQNDDYIELDENITKLLSIQAAMLSSYLENLKILDDYDRQTSILEQKIAARTMDLTRNRKELETIFNAVHSGIIVLNETNNSVIKVNPRACDILDCKEKDAIDIEIDKYLEKIFDSSGNIIKDIDLSASFESYVINKNNERIPIIRTVKMINFGSTKFRIESFNDITELKKAENLLKESNEKLELKVRERTEDLNLLISKLEDEISEREHAESEVRKLLAKERELNELKSRFVSMISHEFRTPLTIIKSSSQMISKFDDKINSEDRAAYLSKISKTVDYMTDLIENVIFIGKSENANRNIKPMVININSICLNIINDFKMTLKTPRIVNTNIDGIDFEVVIDEKLVKLILNNLLTNAAKYSDDDKPIDFYLAINDSHLTLSVKDYGIGIPETERNMIFDVFYRAQNVGNISGTGLGMAVITESLKLLKGTISLESELGKGSIFTVTIPVNKNEK